LPLPPLPLLLQQNQLWRLAGLRGPECRAAKNQLVHVAFFKEQCTRDKLSWLRLQRRPTLKHAPSYQLDTVVANPFPWTMHQHWQLCSGPADDTLPQPNAERWKTQATAPAQDNPSHCGILKGHEKTTYHTTTAWGCTAHSIDSNRSPRRPWRHLHPWGGCTHMLLLLLLLLVPPPQIEFTASQQMLAAGTLHQG